MTNWTTVYFPVNVWPMHFLVDIRINSEVYSIQHYVNLEILCTQGTMLYTREINDLIDLIFGVWRHFQQYFSYIMAASFSGGRSRSTRREPSTMGKQLVNFITCGCESSAPFCNLQSRARTHVVLVIGLYQLLGNPTT
jgi:hypothetical protein